ncbi:hypothetical protein TREMEDRAFT_66313 [Tremella mesenterica DSM 1558]|uniref:uncharacterized protein n=1 Tax=Tremella mesenterica (strain ATCC 24925 / CBS 8224 / DSM 1558 / NBRC 9311 / NRRL Y-6157 / RJB 2259-6 / UBC 559-6) TaxID=578456 RepID=UPI00032C3221|nr:uncharacterized protein TREMEDRAFT_66313 [Tremella mesenterica DSM 1558]EIW65716.1 hypothetical protein TREMEDRAFT_66313 [Tremella mesenterica DSM 1558]
MRIYIAPNLKDVYVEHDGQRDNKGLVVWAKSNSTATTTTTTTTTTNTTTNTTTTTTPGHISVIGPFQLDLNLWSQVCEDDYLYSDCIQCLESNVICARPISPDLSRKQYVEIASILDIDVEIDSDLEPRRVFNLSTCRRCQDFGYGCVPARLDQSGSGSGSAESTEDVGSRQGQDENRGRGDQEEEKGFWIEATRQEGIIQILKGPKLDSSGNVNLSMSCTGQEGREREIRTFGSSTLPQQLQGFGGEGLDKHQQGRNRSQDDSSLGHGQEEMDLDPDSDSDSDSGMIESQTIP